KTIPTEASSIGWSFRRGFTSVSWLVRSQEDFDELLLQYAPMELASVGTLRLMRLSRCLPSACSLKGIGEQTLTLPSDPHRTSASGVDQMAASESALPNAPMW
ncbi:MAG TPA: hypothetical protein VF458_04265, partial [Ktedonobacteraceae bacterium]